MLIWTDNAITHITDFIKEARSDTEKTAKKYMSKLVDYVDTLDDIVILAVLHTRLDIEKALKKLKRDIDL